MVALQLLFNGLIAGSIYALVAVGFSLIYSTNRFIHFAHGATVTVCAYMLFLLFNRWGLNFFTASFFTVVIGAALGWLVYLVVYRPLRARNASNAVLLVASIGLMILMENLMLFWFGAGVKTIGFLPVKKGIEIFGAIITPLQIVIVVITVLVLIILWFSMRYLKFGKLARAVADNPELAQISGINTERVRLQSFMIGSGIAALAAVLIALEQNIEPVMGTPLIIKGFTGAIIGGVTSVPGAVLGSYLLGLVENFGIWWLPSGWKDAIAFVLLFVFLLFKPTGILGINKGVRE